MTVVDASSNDYWGGAEIMGIEGYRGDEMRIDTV